MNARALAVFVVFASGLFASQVQAAVAVRSDGVPICAALPATIVGTPDDDVLYGTSGDDVIVGLDGNDTIYGLEGNDTICGNAGTDMVDDGSGDDVLRGGRDDDRIFGSDADDVIDLSRHGPGDQSDETIYCGNG